MYLKAFSRGFIEALAMIGAVIAANPNACVFAIGLAVLCSSVWQWSPVVAGTTLGVVLMIVAAWPLLMAIRKH